MQKLSEYDDFDFDVEEMLPSSQTNESKPAAPLDQMESALFGLQDSTTSGGGSSKPKVTTTTLSTSNDLSLNPKQQPSAPLNSRDPSRLQSTSSILANYSGNGGNTSSNFSFSLQGANSAMTENQKQAPVSTTDILSGYEKQESTLLAFSTAAVTAVKSNENDLPSFLRSDSSTSRRRKKAGEPAASSASIAPIREESSSSFLIQQQQPSHDDRLKQWCNWLKIRFGDPQLMKFVEKAALLPVPYPWKEQDGMFVHGQSGKRQDRHPLWSDIYQEVEEVRRVQGETSGPSVVKQEERLLVNEDSNVQILKIADSIQPAITKEYRGSLTNVAPVLDTDQLVKLVSDAISAKFAEMMAEQKKEICSIDSKVAQLSEQLDESTTHFIETGKYIAQEFSKQEAHTKDLQSLRHNLQSLTDENLKIFNQVQALTTKNNDSNIKISQTSDSIKKLSDQVQITFSDSLGALKQQSGEMKSLMVDNLKSLDKRVTSISENESRFVSGVQEYLKELSTARNLQKTALDHFQKAQEGIEKRSVTTEETLRKLVSHLENEQNEWKSTKSREKAELQDMKRQIELEVKEYEAERNGRKSNIKGEEEQWKRERASLEDDVRKLLEKKREVDCEIVEKKIGLERVRSDLIANQQEVVSFQNLRKTLTDQEMEIRKMHENAVKERMEAQREMNDVLAARLDLNKLKEHIAKDKKQLVEERQKLEGMRVQITKDMKELSDKRIIWSTSAVSQSGKENRTSPKKKSRFDSINKYIVPTFPTIDPNVLRENKTAREIDPIAQALDDDQKEFLGKVHLKQMILPQHLSKSTGP